MPNKSSETSSQMESKLETLYGGITPDPRFARRLRRQIVKKAAQISPPYTSRSRWLHPNLPNVRQWILGAAALALLVIVLVFSIGLLPKTSPKPAGAPAGTASSESIDEPTNVWPTPLSTMTVQPGPQNPRPEFPFSMGTTWVYSYIPYDPLPSDPAQIITATYMLTETVTEVKSVPPYFAAKVETERVLVSKSPEWTRDDLSSAGESWYVINGDKIYRGSESPDLSNFNPDLTPGWSLEYQLPLSVDERWCPAKYNFESPGQPEIEDCRSLGEKTVAKAMTYETPAGKFDDCYQITESFNSGGTTRWFCNGVGVVAAKYDHAGTRFGFEQTLISYRLGSNPPSPEGTPPATEAPPIVPIAPVLVPEACTTPLSVLSEADRSALEHADAPQALIGGGKVTSDDFAFEIWLACDPSLSRANPGGDRFSEIDGLGILTIWRYDGPDMDGKLTEFAGFEPFVQERGSNGPVSGGTANFGTTGIQFPVGVLPDFSKQDTRLRYQLKVRAPDGTLAGAALSFTLQRQVAGYRPVNIRIEALSAEELQVTGGNASVSPPFATMDPEELYPELKEVRQLLDRFSQPLRSAPGWIHTLVRREDPDGNGLYGSLTAWTNENWYQIDARGYVVAFVYTDRADDGRVLQQTIARDAETQNLTFSITGSFKPHPFDPGADLYNSLLTRLRSDQAANRTEGTRNGHPVWTFIFGDNRPEPTEVDGILTAALQKRDVIDRETGAILLSEMLRITPDGDESLVWRDTNQLIERVDAPPAEVLELLGQEAGSYTPRPPEGTPAPPGFDPSHSQLSKRTIEGDDFERPSFFYGDIYADGYLLGRVNFGSVPDGQCDRSADGSKLAFTYQTGDQEGWLTGSTLRWLDLRDVTAVHEPAPELRVINRVAWSPVGEQIAFSACQGDQEACGLYLYDLPADRVRLLTGAASTIWDVIWKPDGAQLALASAVGDTYTLFILDAANGEVVYQGVFDLDAWRPAANAPINDWGVGIPRGYSGSRCFTDLQASTPGANER
jgi:hypothetical protein